MEKPERLGREPLRFFLPNGWQSGLAGQERGGIGRRGVCLVAQRLRKKKPDIAPPALR
jgi:hypothetical protein